MNIDVKWPSGIGVLILVAVLMIVGFIFMEPAKPEYAWYEAPKIDSPGPIPAVQTAPRTETEWMRYIHGVHYGGKGVLEARLWDRSRVDLLTIDVAVEADWTYKWEEAIGQALHYAKRTGREPVVLLLVRDGFKDSEIMDIMRCQTALDYISSHERPRLAIYDCKNRKWAHEKEEWKYSTVIK